MSDFRRGVERRIVFILDAHESRRAVRRLDHARPPSIFSDERRREGVRSTSVVTSLAIIGGRNLPDSLAKLRRLRLNFAFRERVRLVPRTRINSPQRVQHHNGQSSCAKSSESFTVCLRHTVPFAEISKKLEIVGISDNPSNFVAPFP